MANNCQSDSVNLERLIRTSENEMISLYSLLSDRLSQYFKAKSICCVNKNEILKNAIILIDDYTGFDNQSGESTNTILDNIIDKLLENTPGVFTQYTAAFYKEVCVKDNTPNLQSVIEASFQAHICRLAQEPLPDYTYEATFGNFVCKYDDSELFPYLYEAVFMGHRCIMRNDNYFYAEYEASFQNFVCEFTPGCDTFSTILCSNSEVIESCGLTMTAEWTDYSCFIATQEFDLSFASHSCVRDMSFEASFENYVCIVQDWEFTASFISFVCQLACAITVDIVDSFPATTTTTTSEEPVTTTTIEEVTTTTTTEPAATTTTTTAEVTTTTTTIGFTDIHYGALYNWYSATDVRGIAPAGWHVPTSAEWTTLVNYIGDHLTAGGKLKETGFIYWDSPNTGATNEVGFNGRGGGRRIGSSGIFSSMNIFGGMQSVTAGGSSTNYILQLRYGNTEVGDPTAFPIDYLVLKKDGWSIRCVKDDSADPGSVTDYDGNVYPTTKIGSQVWMAANLAVTHYNNGDAIAEVTDNSAWAALTTGAYCWYNNNIANK